MNIQSISPTFDFHVDPMFFGFQWTEAQYITVEYSALKQDGEVVASVHKISATPWLIGSITIRGNWMAVDKEITAAAQDHAKKEFGRNGHVDQTVMSAIAPHIGL